MNFKIGDRVRKKKRSIFAGLEGVVTSLPLECGDQLKVRVTKAPDDDSVERQPGSFSIDFAEYFELIAPEVVQPGASELQALVDKVNEGYRARVALAPLASKIEFRTDYYREWTALNVGSPLNTEYRIKPEPPKPVFEAFTAKSGPWEVKLFGGTLHIGCKTFGPEQFLHALTFFSPTPESAGSLDNSYYQDNVKMTRVGLEFKFSGGTEKHLLLWEDCDRIQAALEKAGIK